ncbi:MAG: BolA family transcriptional regulator [Burkholderiales bacterium]|nr:BolA family transcriptional regulator [Burkholderiales bacterium]
MGRCRPLCAGRRVRAGRSEAFQEGVALTRTRIVESLADLNAQILEVADESERHSGHAGAGGGGHYRLTVVSDCFSGQTLMARHRLIYGMLSGMMKSEIHALAVNAYTPSEYHLKQPT